MSGRRRSATGNAELLAVKTISLIIVSLLVVIALSRPWGVERIPAEQVWAKADELGRKNDLDPLLIYSIACAESSLNAHAGTPKARGIMQMSIGAWESVCSRSYIEAWDWRINMEEAVAYMVHLRSLQQAAGKYNWVNLAAAYRHGPNALKRAQYDPDKLPRPTNDIYRELFAGRTPKLPGPAPKREIRDAYAPLPEPPPALPDPA